MKSIWEVDARGVAAAVRGQRGGHLLPVQALGQRIRSGGAIVNLSSTSAKLATTVEVTPYSSSKAAVLGITRSFAYVLAPRNVRVNAICPGIIDTPMQDKVLRGGRRRCAARPPRSWPWPGSRPCRWVASASADECAGVIWFLLSDAAAYMTGQAINHTGGLVMW